jgi:glucose-6-phosphate 1-dehydrogenase
MEKSENCIIVIFGATGDLARRKLIPSLYDLFRQQLLPDNFAVLGIGQTPLNDESFRDRMAESISTFLKSDQVDPRTRTEFLKHLYYQSMDNTAADGYPLLKQRLMQLDHEVQAKGNLIYYLATFPDQFEVIARNLGLQGMQKQGNGFGWKRIVFEKPFGYDLLSAQNLSRRIQQIFHEEYIYRIDHYLGKETVQNILAFRFANGIFEPLWNRNYIHHVELTAAEDIGVENRGRYYDHAGALRDMVQNHLLQLLATVAMESPAKFEAATIRNEKVKVFQSLCPIPADEVPKRVIRGQYLASTIRGKKVNGYRDETNVSPESKTETFVAMKFSIDNWRWGGVPFYIRSGKRLPTKVSEIVIHFKKTPHYLFTRELMADIPANQLILRIQPDEGILLKFGMKLPGAGFQIKTVNMDFHYSDLGNPESLPDAYQRLLLDCILGDPTLFARSDSVEACWSFLMPVLEAWQNNPDIKLYGYPAGTWGPVEANTLFGKSGEEWRYPCKNLAQDGEYCEL